MEQIKWSKMKYFLISDELYTSLYFFFWTPIIITQILVTMDAFNNWRTDMMAICQERYVGRLSAILSLFKKKTVSCNVTGVGENDRATFTKLMSDRSNGFIISTVAIDMSEKSCTREINERFCQKSIYSSFTANDFDENFWK